MPLIPPLALQSLGLALTGAGAGFDFLDALNSSTVQRQNAAILRRNADLTAFNGRQQARQLSIAGTKGIGQAKAVYAGSGLAQSGSLLDVVREQEQQYELESAKADFNGRITAQGLRHQASMLQYQARVNTIGGGVRLPVSVLTGGLLALR